MHDDHSPLTLDDRVSIVPAGTMAFVATDQDDGPVASYESVDEAVAAAVDLRGDEASGSELRIAIHVGEARVDDDGEYSGPAVRRCAGLVEIANPGQTLVSARAVAAIAETLPAEWTLRDLGVHRLRDLSNAERVAELRLAGEVREFPPLRSLDATPNNLPTQLASFVGRRRELSEIGALLAAERLVTITGAGGSGKTRLAAHAAATLVDRFRDGVWWVELAQADDAPSVHTLVASALDVLVEPAGGALHSLSLYLRDRQLLVCLDNCEHVLDASAAVAEQLLRSCPEVSLLTTSREPLNVPGEVVWRAPTLGTDESVALFLERASLVRPWFTLDSANEPAVRALCERLDGIPLAIELAAAWLRTLTPHQIADGLRHRLSLLAGGRRGMPPRQQTMSASIDWSHDLLESADRAIFRRLAVFVGGFTLDAARDVCADDDVHGDDVLDVLRRLVDKSFVVAELDREADGERPASAARYRLLEPIRQYARDRLDDAAETAATRDRHLGYFLRLAEDAEPLLDVDIDAWRVRIDVEYENLRAALDVALAADDPDRGRRLAAALPWLWNMHRRGHDGLAVMRRAIGLAPGDRSLLQAKLLTNIGIVADTTAPFDLEHAQLGMEIAAEHGDARLEARCQLLLAVGHLYRDFDESWRLAEEASRTAEPVGDAYVTDGALALRGIILHLRDRHAEALTALQGSVDGLLRRGERGIASTVLGRLSGSALHLGNIGEARLFAERAVDIAEPLGDYHRVGTSRSQLALVLGVSGDVDGGLAVLQPVVVLVEGATHQVFVPGLAHAVAALHLWRGDIDDALRWLKGDVTTPVLDADDTYVEALATPLLGTALMSAGRLDEARDVLDRTLADARKRDMPSVVADALHAQGMLTLGDDPSEAADLLHQALTVRLDHGLRLGCVDSLDALGRHAAHCEDHADAARLLAAADAARSAMGYPRPPADVPGHQVLVDHLRTTLGDGPFGEAYEEGSGLSLDEAVAYVRRTRGTRGRPSTGWASLTPTELDVVRLVVEGLNNPDIGARLFMSRGTVKTHLSHVFAKLGVANRTELATLASTRVSNP